MKNFLNLKFFAIFFAVLIISLLFPFHQAQAWIGALAANIAFALIAVILEIVVLVTSAILFLCRIVLVIIINPNLITIPYTSGGIVAIGWPIVRDFANLGFTLALIFIGLATALQLDDYGAKKALPRLLGMALLINFTPVICGLIVDASNIIMNFFLGATGDFSAIVNLSSSHYSSTLNKLNDFFTKSVSLEIVAEAGVISIFNILAGFFFLLYAFLFLVRYVAIWTLVIVSPLAFFANVFPKTSSYYRQWWNQFIQWCFVGIPASFFLYLSWHILDQADSIIISPAPSAWGNFIDIGPVLSSLLVYGVVVIFLFIGFLSSLSSGAMGATVIISAAKSWGGKKAQAIRKRAGRAIIGSKPADKLINKMAGNEKKGPIGWGVRALGLKGKEIRGNMQKSLDSIKDGKIDAILNTKDSAAAAAYLKDPMIDKLNKIKLVERMAEEWDEEDMLKVRQVDDTLIDKTVTTAANRGLLPTVNKMVKDKPILARLKAVCDAKIDPADAKTKTDLENKLTDIQSIISRRGTAKETQADIDTLDELAASFNDPAKDSAWLANELSGKKINDIIKEKKDAYYAIAGEHNLERTIRGMSAQSVAKLSSISLKSKRIQQLAAQYWTPEKYNKVYETFGSKPFDDFSQGIEVFNSANLARHNSKLGGAAYSGNLRYLFKNRPAIEREDSKTPMVDASGNQRIITTREEWDNYVTYINGGPNPLWMRIKCSYCGKGAPVGATTCPFCGAPITLPPPQPPPGPAGPAATPPATPPQPVGPVGPIVTPPKPGPILTPPKPGPILTPPKPGPILTPPKPGPAGPAATQPVTPPPIPIGTTIKDPKGNQGTIFSYNDIDKSFLVKYPQINGKNKFVRWDYNAKLEVVSQPPLPQPGGKFSGSAIPLASPQVNMNFPSQWSQTISGIKSYYDLGSNEQIGRTPNSTLCTLNGIGQPFEINRTASEGQIVVRRIGTDPLIAISADGSKKVEVRGDMGFAFKPVKGWHFETKDKKNWQISLQGKMMPSIIK